MNNYGETTQYGQILFTAVCLRREESRGLCGLLKDTVFKGNVNSSVVFNIESIVFGTSLFFYCLKNKVISVALGLLHIKI